jgi:putative transposase
MSDTAEAFVVEQEEIQTNLQQLFRGAVKFTLEAVLEEVVREMVGAGRWARTGHRKDQRNGTYLRGLLTSLGYVEVAVPRTRNQGAPTDVIGRYKRRATELDDAIVASYVHGVSTRKVGEVTEALLGERVGRSSVSRVTKRLDEAVAELRQAPIAGPIPYLYLDATFLDARWARRVENVSALVAYGVGLDGKRQLLAVTIGAQESEESWSDLMRQVLDRGLAGVRLVIADEHAGLAAAVRKHLPEAERQRCIVHLQRNVLAKIPHRLRKRIARAVANVFKADSLRESKKRLAQLERDWAKQVPEAIECLKNGFAAATRFYAFPKAHWVRIRSTNGLERLHGEIKRRIRSVGAFPDRDSALRLVTAVALHTASVWGSRRYLDMSLLDAVDVNESRS